MSTQKKGKKEKDNKTLSAVDRPLLQSTDSSLMTALIQIVLILSIFYYYYYFQLDFNLLRLKLVILNASG